MELKGAIMGSFFLATLGLMLIIGGIIFIVYSIVYQRKNDKKIAREIKIIPFFVILIGIVILTLSMLYINNNILQSQI